MTLRVKNWKQFQHFKDRKPPWVKLYRDLLDDVEWYEMAGEDFKFLVGLWLLASESEGPDGELPPLKGIAFRLRVSERVARDRISRLNHWLVGSCEALRQDNINVISKLRQVGPSETETEGELETEAEGTAPASTFDAFWTAYPRKVGKGAALAAWKKAKPTKETARVIIEAVEAQKHSRQWLDSDGRFIPNPATWLNQGRWQDETETKGTESWI
jgi:hypothetical protein